MKKDDIVCWTSQAAGHSKRKEGVIVQVIKQGKNPRDYHFHGDFGLGYSRPDESYLVKVGSKLYWPHATKLEPVEG